MKIFVTGAGGQLGSDVLRCLRQRGHEVTGSFHRLPSEAPEDGIRRIGLDITDREAVFAAVRAERPEAVIHCAAWTAVDRAEAPEAREAVFAVNADGTRYAAEAAESVGAKLVYVSSEYVFDGRGDRPWRPEDPASPLNVYGRSKLAGEEAVRAATARHFIVRTSWLFGANGENFIKTMIRLGKARDSVRVVDDQTGRPTYTKDLAELLADMAESERFGTYHASGEGTPVSRYGLCRECFRQAGLAAAVIPVSTAEFGAAGAVRPANSVLDTSKLVENGFAALPDWRDAVGRYLAEAKL